MEITDCRTPESQHSVRGREIHRGQTTIAESLIPVLSNWFSDPHLTGYVEREGRKGRSNRRGRYFQFYLQRKNAHDTLRMGANSTNGI